MGAILFGLIGSFFVYMTARKLRFTPTEAAWSVALMHLVPLVAAGHVLMLHDTVMLAAAAALLYALSRAVFEGARIWWAICGVVAALALYAKFSAVVLAVGIAVFLIGSREHRRLLLRPDVYLAAGIASVLFAPVLAWNAKHEWIAALAVKKLAFQPDLTLSGRALNLLDFLGSQAVLISPVFLVMMLIAAVAAIRTINREPHREEGFLAAMFLGIFAYFLLQSLRAKVQGNWAALAYLPGMLLMVRYGSRRVAEGFDAWRTWGKIGLALCLVTTFLFMAQPIFRVVPLPTGLDMTDQVHGWRDLARRVDHERKKRPDLVLAARRYQVAGELQFYCQGHPEIFVANWSSRGNQYDLINDWSKLEGRSVLYVDVQGRSGKLWRHFGSAVPLPDFERRRAGRAVQTVHLTILENFRLDGPLERYFESPEAYAALKMRRYLKGED